MEHILVASQKEGVCIYCSDVVVCEFQTEMLS